MAFFAVLAAERSQQKQLNGLLEPTHSVALARSWGGLERVIKERPVTGAVLDLGAVLPVPSLVGALAGLRGRFPHLGLILLVHQHRDPFTLFRLGRAGIRNLILLDLDDLESELRRTVIRSMEWGVASVVTRFLSPHLPRRELRIVHLALDSLHRGWNAEEMSKAAGLSRPFLSERLKEFGLPSLGHLLLWIRLFHAGHWLEEPGRTGESVGRQLDYSSGAAFRRALKHYTGATPTQVREGGGLSLVLREFSLRNDLRAPRASRRVSVA